jgi:hypothetical protein
MVVEVEVEVGRMGGRALEQLPEAGQWVELEWLPAQSGLTWTGR